MYDVAYDHDSEVFKLFDAYVDLTSGWFNIYGVNSYCDSGYPLQVEALKILDDDTKIKMARDLVSYFGHHEFEGGSIKASEDINDIYEELKFREVVE